MDVKNLTMQAFTALSQGQYSLASRYAHQLLDKAPKDRAALTVLGRVALIEQKPLLAAGFFHRILKQPDPDIASWLDLAQAHTLMRDTAGARNAIDQALAIDGSNAQANLAKAKLMLSLGKKRNASVLLHRVLEADPTNLQALRSLCELGQAEPESNIAIRLQHIAFDQQAPKPSRAYALYALASVYKKSGDNALFFEYLSRANAIQREKYNDDLYSAYRSSFLRLELAFSKDTLSKSAKAKPSSPKPIFIVGMPRSGTTLVEQLIAAHPDIASGGELDFIRGPLTKAQENLTGKAFPLGFETLSTTQMSDLAGLFLERITTIAGGKPLVTDKTPGNYHILGLLPLLFPGCKIIHVRRNPMDTCFSILQQAFDDRSPHTCDVELLALTYAHYRRQMENWQRLLGDQILHVDYEVLVENTVHEARRMFHFCGLEWHDDYLNFHNQLTPIHTFSAFQARHPIYQSSVNAWMQYRDELTPLRRALERHRIF